MSELKQLEQKLVEISQRIQSLFKENDINSLEVLHRIKDPSAILKRIAHGEYLSDLLALRVLLPTKEDCLNAGRIIYDNYKILEGRFRDYITNPWDDGYQTLHIDFFADPNTVIEIQLRTPDMDTNSKKLINKKGQHYWKKYR